jgi:hypothetical protein
MNRGYFMLDLGGGAEPTVRTNELAFGGQRDQIIKDLLQRPLAAVYHPVNAPR